MAKTLVIIPTFNERENLEPITLRVLACDPSVDVLVVDDSLPDGTGALADEIAAREKRVQVLHRASKNGLGEAYLEAFGWALSRGYDRLVQLDADGSHAPEQLPSLLAAAESTDVVLGSRWVPGGRVENWPWYRRALSKGGSTYARLMLRLQQRDATGGYRVYSARALEAMNLSDVESHGYCFQIDMLLHAVRAGLTVVEVPITFTERTLGASKMSGSIVLEAMLRVTVWGFSGMGVSRSGTVAPAAASREG
ncbi:polyprenol monophosphomannose synthase [Glaciibacter superstes]|uniref:polyprenol monophosphomannose synthase n=1 Tax=Glaciibacter superstes TaxID=501023 RepID=UPI0003B574CC|nr:polyprenol monophosphomannose synthase [Glaciibacter superstes]